MTWDNAYYGGVCSAVRDQLNDDVQQIQSTEQAFAAFLANGSVVTWGSGTRGESSAVRGLLMNA